MYVCVTGICIQFTVYLNEYYMISCILLLLLLGVKVRKKTPGIRNLIILSYHVILLHKSCMVLIFLLAFVFTQQCHLVLQLTNFSCHSYIVLLCIWQLASQLAIATATQLSFGDKANVSYIPRHMQLCSYEIKNAIQSQPLSL